VKKSAILPIVFVCSVLPSCKVKNENSKTHAEQTADGKTAEDIGLLGDWTTDCVLQKDGSFMFAKLKVEAGKAEFTFAATYDSVCKVLASVTTHRSTYKLGGTDPVDPKVHFWDQSYYEKITVLHDQAAVDNFNREVIGGFNDWALNVPKKIVLSPPNKESQVFKFENGNLFIGFIVDLGQGKRGANFPNLPFRRNGA
jgi:hypothetical protein